MLRHTAQPTTDLSLRSAVGIAALLLCGCGVQPTGTGYQTYGIPPSGGVRDTGTGGGPFTFEKDVGPAGGVTPTDAGGAALDGGAPLDAGAPLDTGSGPLDTGGASGGGAIDSGPVSGGGGSGGGGPDAGAGSSSGGGSSGGGSSGGGDAGSAPDVPMSGDTGKPPISFIDNDGDGYPPGQGIADDCDDNDPKVHPGMTEVCNGKDDDCTGIPDDLDMDGDGFSKCKDDCDDTDININPLAGRDCKNGKDNDCSGVIDAQEDGDGDGFKGCSDCDDYDKSTNPNAFETPVDLIDNDCDGQTDEPPVPCDPGTLNTNNIGHYAKAIDICKSMGTEVLSSTFVKQAANNSRAIKKSYGTNIKPQEGAHFVVLSSGVAAAKGQPGYKLPQSGTAFTNSAAYPPVKCKNSGTVYDYTEWQLKLKVPAGAKSFSFDFNFMSSEYPEWVGSKFNDKFLAILTSKKFKGNVSFDSKGNCISINNAFFTVCKGCSKGDKGLQGTGYENGIGGGTGWLTTTSPVTPGEIITLRFIVFDEGDHILDSAVVLDNFRWDTQEVKGGSPSTIRPGA